MLRGRRRESPCFVWQGDGTGQVEIVDYHGELLMAKLLDEIHPGEVLLEDFMKPMARRRASWRLILTSRPAASVTS